MLKYSLDKLEKLSDQISSVGIVMSDNAKFIWESELGTKIITIIILNFMIQWILWLLCI